MRTLLIVMSFAVALSSCKRQPPPPPVLDPAPTTAAVDASPAPSSSAPDVDPYRPMKDLAKQWNEAINRHDIAALGAMHGPMVRFYGTSVDNATYCAKMKAALDKDPSFHQEIDAVRLEWSLVPKAKVSFRKKDKKTEYASYLVMEKSDGSWKIIEESDLVSDANTKCASSDEVTLAGTIEEGAFFWHDHATPTLVLQLSAPICVRRSPDDEWIWGDRVDGVEAVTLLFDQDASTPAQHTKVRIRGTHLQPHSGSGHYSTELLAFVESISVLP